MAPPDTYRGTAFFNWFADDGNSVAAPFYGGYLAALALADSDNIVATDDGNSSYAQYVLYKRGKPSKVVLINTDYFSGNGTRSTTTFSLKGLKNGRVKAIRMTAPSSEVTTTLAQTNPAQEPRIAGKRSLEIPQTHATFVEFSRSKLTPTGQYFSNRDCKIRGSENFESAQVTKGAVTFTLAASEALIVYL